jgi:hypothetical protein
MSVNYLPPSTNDADLALIEELRLARFSGPRYDAFIDGLYRYAWPVMLAAIRTGSIVSIGTAVPHRTIPADELQLLHDSAEEREELALASIGRAERKFKVSLKRHFWDPAKGRSLRSYFIGACAQAFWEEYAAWSDRRHRQLRAIANLAARRDLAHDEFADDPEMRQSQQDAVELLLAKAKRWSPELEAICVGLRSGLTAAELAEKLGYSDRAIESRLYHFRWAAWDLVRSGRIDPAVVPGSRARIARKLAKAANR